MAEDPKKNLLISQKKLGGVNSKLNPVDRVQSANDDTAGFSNIERIKAGERKTDRSMPAAASHYQNILSVVMRREGILEGIYEHLGRIKKLVIDASNATLSKADKVNIQGEIDFYLDQISRECAGLPQLAEGDARLDQPGALDAESLAALSKKVDLGYLGLDKGIPVTQEYGDLIQSTRQALTTALEASSNPEQRGAASSRIVAFDAAARKFPQAVERYVARNLERNLPPIPASISFVEQLADELSQAAPSQHAAGLNASDLLLLAGGQENFAIFLEQLREVPSYPLNLSLVENALAKVHGERGKLKEVEMKISNMVQTTKSDQHPGVATDRSISDAMSDIVNQQSESPLMKAALERLSRDKEDKEKTIILLR